MSGLRRHGARRRRCTPPPSRSPGGGRRRRGERDDTGERPSRGRCVGAAEPHGQLPGARGGPGAAPQHVPGLTHRVPHPSGVGRVHVGPLGRRTPRVELRTGTNGFPTYSRMPSTYAVSVSRSSSGTPSSVTDNLPPSLARLRIPIRTREAPPRVGGEEVRDALETVEAVAGAACLYCRGVPARHPHGRRGVLGVIGSIGGLSPRPPSCPLDRCRLSRPGSIVHAGRESPGKPWHG